MVKLNRILGGASGLAVLAVLAPAVTAQDADDSFQLEEIVVTAQKREESLQDTPIAVSAISGADLAVRGTSNISELQSFVPNLVFDTTSPVSGLSSGAVVFIRGIGQTDFQLTTDPGVGTYVDGVYISRSAGGVLDVLELERAEVLRGPQGTLFGRNTIGGAISLTSRRPGDEFAVSGAFTYGSRDRIDARLVIDAPISDSARFMVVGSTKNQDGYVRNPNDSSIDLGDVNRDSLRATLDLDVTENLTATVAFDATRIREQNAASRLVGISITAPGAPTRTDIFLDRGSNSVVSEEVAVPPGNPSLTFLHNVIDSPVLGVAPFDGAFISTDLDTTFATGTNGTELDIWGTSLTLDWDVGNTTIKSISAYRETSGFFNRDADGSPLAVTQTENADYDHTQFSQELQATGIAFADRLKWAAGLYYFYEDGNDLLTVTLPIGFGTVNNFTFVENESYAVYAQGTYDLTSALSATFGARYSDDTKEYTAPVGGAGITNGLAAVFGPTGTFTPFFPAGTNEDSFGNFSIKAGLDYKFDDGTLVYASYSEGYKSGGFNTRYLVPVPDAVSFEPEELVSYEVGVKWQGFNNRVRLNAAAFHADYSDIQLIVYEQGAPITRNAGSANINGIELEATVLATENLLLSGGLGYLDAEYSDVPALDPLIDPAQQIQLDTRLANTPEWSLNAAAEYTVPLFDGSSLTARADWSYKSSVENDAVNSRFLSEGAINLLNVRVSYRSPDESWGLTAYSDNITDERFITSGDSNFGIGFHEANFNRPREFGVTLDFRF